MSVRLTLSEDEADLIRLLRDREREVIALAKKGDQERKAWEKAHPGEWYSALSIDGSSGGKAYSLCAETAAEFTTKAMDVAARRLGLSGWQGSYAELEFLRRSRRIEGPFGIYQAHDMLYPQYDVLGRIEKMLTSDDTVKWLGDQAEKKLAERTHASPNVIAHWERLVQDRDAL